MSNIVGKPVSRPQRREVNLFIYAWLAFDYPTFDKNKFTVVTIFFRTMQRDEDNRALMDSCRGLIMSAR